jgi:hypothetical protein
LLNLYFYKSTKMVCFITTAIDIFNEQLFPNDTSLNYTPTSEIKLG